MTSLPCQLERIGVPPIKCQGIKTKLVPFIFSQIKWPATAQAHWIEPFLGSGVVAFNLAPERALLADTNQHIIRFYQALQCGEINRGIVREFLNEEGRKLAAGGADYYYEVRRRFNEHAAPLDFLFLNRSCFNGVVRFNRKGHFNVPFGHKPERFAQAYITKIVNQVGWVTKQMQNKDWEFRVADWRVTFAKIQAEDFVYLDPPYLGRHTDYFNHWGEADAVNLADSAQHLPCGFALSMWLENRYRRNEHLARYWQSLEQRVASHFYHVGSTEDLRNEMTEALILKPGYAAEAAAQAAAAIAPQQLSLYAL